MPSSFVPFICTAVALLLVISAIAEGVSVVPIQLSKRAGGRRFSDNEGRFPGADGGALFGRGYTIAKRWLWEDAEPEDDGFLDGQVAYALVGQGRALGNAPTFALAKRGGGRSFGHTTRNNPFSDTPIYYVLRNQLADDSMKTKRGGGRLFPVDKSASDELIM